MTQQSDIDRAARHDGVKLTDDDLALVVGGSGYPGSGEPDKTGAH